VDVNSGNGGGGGGALLLKLRLLSHWHDSLHETDRMQSVAWSQLQWYLHIEANDWVLVSWLVFRNVFKDDGCHVVVLLTVG
jgi:hypothetical protein